MTGILELEIDYMLNAYRVAMQQRAAAEQNSRPDDYEKAAELFDRLEMTAAAAAMRERAAYYEKARE